MVTAASEQMFLRINIVGAIYCITDMIIFEVLQKGDEQYLNICIQINEDDERVFLFKWDHIPENIRVIYEYVKDTSIIEESDNIFTLYGNHIGRRNNHKYVLANFMSNPLNHVVVDIVESSDMDETSTVLVAAIAENMMIVKNL